MAAASAKKDGQHIGKKAKLTILGWRITFLSFVLSFWASFRFLPAKKVKWQKSRKCKTRAPQNLFLFRASSIKCVICEGERQRSIQQGASHTASNKGQWIYTYIYVCRLSRMGKHWRRRLQSMMSAFMYCIRYFPIFFFARVGNVRSCAGKGIETKGKKLLGILPGNFLWQKWLTDFFCQRTLIMSTRNMVTCQHFPIFFQRKAFR